MWPDRRLLDLFGIEHPIILAPMGGAMDSELTAAVAEAGGLGSLPCMMYTADKVREEVGKFRARTKAPINLGFFTHKAPAPDNAREASWRDRLKRYYTELGLDPNAAVPAPARSPFNDEVCSLVEELKPAAVAFHFGLPAAALVNRVKAAGAKVISSATTVAEARWLEEHGADVIIAQGAEAGGHRGIFLSEDISSQAGTFALVPQVVDAVRVPVVAAGAVADARGIAAAFALGASGVQLGTAYLHCPESKISKPHRQALKEADDTSTVLTNIMSGRPARGIVNRLIREQGPIAEVPAFPNAANALGPLRAAAEKTGSGEFSPLWSGQAASLGRAIPAGELTRALATEALKLLVALGTAARKS
jgi:nitronate monooxygenase